MKKPAKNGLEWTVFIASSLVVLAVLGYLATKALTEKKTPPNLRIEAGAAIASNGSYRLPLVVRNTGGTAESVVIEAVLRRGEQELERAQLALSFVPQRSEREGWVTFRHDPQGCTVETRAVSYADP
ncbi:MAG TPA: hypothetical protein VF266_17695 [Thermoanaerobaculia bacterium]